jgi:ATP-dependent helicase HepA
LSDCSFIFQIDRIPEIIHRELFVSKNSFVPGQRWVSNTESELGLGIVVDVANRRVEISFPAAGERRTYAIENAPISRVRYEIGQKVSNEENVFIEIAEVLDNGGCLIYSGNTESGENLIQSSA